MGTASKNKNTGINLGKRHLKDHLTQLFKQNFSVFSGKNFQVTFSIIFSGTSSQATAVHDFSPWYHVTRPVILTSSGTLEFCVWGRGEGAENPYVPMHRDSDLIDLEVGLQGHIFLKLP